jgi:hypothetical protein
VQQPELFEGLTDLTTLAGAHHIWEYGAANILDVLKNIQEMLTMVKKCDSQDSTGSEREQQNNCSRDATFRNGRSCATVLQAKNVRLFSKTGLGRWSLFGKTHRSISKRGPPNYMFAIFGF